MDKIEPQNVQLSPEFKFTVQNRKRCCLVTSLPLALQKTNRYELQRM